MRRASLPGASLGLLEEKEHLGRCAAYEMSRSTYYVDGWINHCWYPDRRVRLYDRRRSETAANRLYEEGYRASVLTPIARGAATLLKTYLLERGFLDGFSGLVVSVLSGAAVFTKYSKLRYLQRSPRSAPGS